MTFYVQGQPDGEPVPLTSDASYIESATTWVQSKLVGFSDCSLDDAVEWSKDTARSAWNRSKQAFKYLSGDPLPLPPLPPTTPQSEKASKNKESTGAWSFAGIFSSLRTPKSSASRVTSPKYSEKRFTEGEVHADLIKVFIRYFRPHGSLLYFVCAECRRLLRLQIPAGRYSK